MFSFFRQTESPIELTQKKVETLIHNLVTALTKKNEEIFINHYQPYKIPAYNNTLDEKQTVTQRLDKIAHDLQRYMSSYDKQIDNLYLQLCLRFDKDDDCSLREKQRDMCIRLLYCADRLHYLINADSEGDIDSVKITDFINDACTTLQNLLDNYIDLPPETLWKQAVLKHTPSFHLSYYLTPVKEAVVGFKNAISDYFQPKTDKQETLNTENTDKEQKPSDSLKKK